MKSIVTKLFDRSQLTVPAELGKWRITDREVEEQLVVLSHSHAVEAQAEEVQAGDSVRLICENGSLRDRAVLLFPGLQLPGAAAAEEAVLKRKVGETVAVEVNGAPQRLTVEKILRRSPAVIDDALAQSEHLEGVTTLDEYRRWYRGQTENQNREQAQKNISYFILDEIARRSEFALDREELDAWKEQQAGLIFEESLAMGEDPRIPEDGFELLTDEQAIERIKKSIEPQFKMELVCRALCAQQGISLTWEDARGEFEAMFLPGELANIPEDELERSRTVFMENLAASKVYGFLFKEAAAYLED